MYEARSPLHNLGGFAAPVAFFQGLEDKVVPPNQAQAMYDALAAKGITTALVLFEGEQHGFRQAANIRCAAAMHVLCCAMFSQTVSQTPGMHSGVGPCPASVLTPPCRDPVAAAAGARWTESSGSMGGPWALHP